MLKRAITYESFDGETVTEDFYFHISKAELAELELGKHKHGGMEAWLKNIIADEDGTAIVEELRKIILMSVGRKSSDGRRFVKTEEIKQDFLSSPAYEVIFMELVTNADKAAEFIAACIPSGVTPEDLKQNVFQTGADRADVPASTAPEADPTAIEPPRPHPSDPAASPAPQTDSEGRRILTERELTEMTHSEVSHLIATGQAVIGA